MKDGKLYALWGVLYIFCGLLGFIREPNGFVTALLVLMVVGFFVPGAVLLYRGYKARNPWRIKAVCAISLVWLVMTLVLLVLNFLTAGATALAGDLLYGFLVILSAPMFCGQAWVLSLFLWACLLMSGLSCLKKIKQ
jgi:hypothetical protein